MLWEFFAWALLGVLGLQRLVEIATNRRNLRRLLDQGARLVGDDGYGLLVVTHALFYALAALEILLSPWPRVGWWTLPGIALFVLGEGLRGWAIQALGARYSTRVVVLPQAPLVASGPYRLLRHPIYVGITIVLVGFPMAFGLWGTLVIVGAFNAVALARRIRREDRALATVVPS
jgi:methyltransferase